MTSKEALNEICKECNTTSDCDKKYGACPNFNKVWDDLEILEEIRDYFKVIDYGEEYQNRYALQIGYPYPAGTIISINKELYLKWNGWLNE